MRARPLDGMLQDLRRLGLGYIWSLGDLCVWEAVCPCCRRWGLKLREPFPGGPVGLDCLASGCDDAAIRWAFTADPLAWRVAELERALGDALALAEDARDIAARAVELLTTNDQEQVAA
jgi:hypothetical protein